MSLILWAVQMCYTDHNISPDKCDITFYSQHKLWITVLLISFYIWAEVEQVEVKISPKPNIKLALNSLIS